jgi:hypothetical protein
MLCLWRVVNKTEQLPLWGIKAKKSFYELQSDYGGGGCSKVQNLNYII